MSFRLPRLYPIVDIGTLQRCGLDLRATVLALVEGGAEILQLRYKHGSPQDILRAAEVMTAAVGSAKCLPVMNDRVDLMLLAGWRAVHLGHNDMPPAAARAVCADAEMVLGVSTHRADQVEAAEAAPVDYVAIGPVFGTTTKADAEPVVGLEGVRQARALTQKPLVAIGGITRENAVSVIDAGADAMAVIGGLLAEAEPLPDVLRDFSSLLR